MLVPPIVSVTEGVTSANRMMPAVTSQVPSLSRAFSPGSPPFPTEQSCSLIKWRAALSLLIALT